MGGISGAILYSLAYSILPYFSLEMKYSSVIGASASIMAIVIAISAIIPNYSVNLFLFGSVRLKYLAIITIIIDIISIQYGNPGGHIAHLGGGLFGYWFGIRYNKGKDITLAFSKIFLRKPSFFKKKSKIKIMYQRPVSDFEYNKQKADIQRELDRILDKISKSGYNSLTKEEKDFLASKK